MDEANIAIEYGYGEPAGGGKLGTWTEEDLGYSLADRPIEGVQIMDAFPITWRLGSSRLFFLAFCLFRAFEQFQFFRYRFDHLFVFHQLFSFFKMLVDDF